jgi:hypothetical protein
MKTYALYGFISALAGAFLTLIEFFTGLHSDAAKLPAANLIGGIGAIAIIVTCIILGTKARREEVPLTEDFGYGAAFFAGFMISFVSTVLSTAFSFIYNSYINPAMMDIILQDRLSKLEASGMSGDRLDKAESMTRMMMSPIPLAIYLLIVGVIVGLVLSLITAAFLKRQAALPPKV